MERIIALTFLVHWANVVQKTCLLSSICWRAAILRHIPASPVQINIHDWKDSVISETQQLRQPFISLNNIHCKSASLKMFSWFFGICHLAALSTNIWLQVMWRLHSPEQPFSWQLVHSVGLFWVLLRTTTNCRAGCSLVNIDAVYFTVE